MAKRIYENKDIYLLEQMYVVHITASKRDITFSNVNNLRFVRKKTLVYRHPSEK